MSDPRATSVLPLISPLSIAVMAVQRACRQSGTFGIGVNKRLPKISSFPTLNNQAPPRPEVGQVYHTPILKVPVEVRAVSQHFVICDREIVYGRDSFARLFMGWQP